MGSPPNYWDYLKLDRVLSLQGGLGECDEDLTGDELHFIVVHQTYELWFKLVLKELRLARDRLDREFVREEEIPRAVHHLERVIRIFRLAVDQFDVMETLSPQDFLAFRDKLVPASGFQSFQMRELEILLGIEDDQRYRYEDTDALDHIRVLAESSPAGEMAWGRIEAARRETTLKEVVIRWLRRTPVRGSSLDDEGDEAAVDGFLADYLAMVEKSHESLAVHMAKTHGQDPEIFRRRFGESTAAAREFLSAEDVDEEIRATVRRARAGLLFIESYRDLPLLAWPRTLVEKVVELEQLLIIWRSRHARMVERMIGRRVGSGGSSGVDYLDQTTKYRIFTDLWAVRTLLLPREELPPIEDPGAYGFAS